MYDEISKIEQYDDEIMEAEMSYWDDDKIEWWEYGLAIILSLIFIIMLSPFLIWLFVKILVFFSRVTGKF